MSISRLRIIILLSYFCSLPAGAWTHGARILGPGDLNINSSITAWWGFRCYSQNYTGNVAQIINSNSGKTTILHCTGGILDVVAGQDSLATLVSDCNSSHAFCTMPTWYDQSGKTSCTAAACDLAAVGGNGPVISNCPTFTAAYRFCLTTSTANTPRWDSSSALTAIATAFSMIALENPISLTNGSDTGDGVVIAVLDHNQFIELNQVEYQYVSPGAGLISNGVVPSGWAVVGASDLNSASLLSYLQINSGAPTTTVLGTHASVSGTIRIDSYPNSYYIEETGIWSDDIHASFSSYYSNASTALGGF